MAWRLAAGLGVLRHQIMGTHWRAAPPATLVVSWGTVGDPDHWGTNSDHNPRDFPSWGSDIVTAIDFPHRPDLELDAWKVVEAIRISRDARVKYVIFNRRMYSSYRANGIAPYTWRAYSGSDPHTDHAHVSSVGDSRADQTHPWQIGKTPMADIDPTNTPNAWTGAVRIDALLKGQTTYTVNWGSGPVTETNAVAAAFAALTARLTAIETAVSTPAPVTITVEQLAQLADLIAARVPAAPTAAAIAEAVADEDHARSAA